MVIYAFGAVLTLWLGDRRIGTLDPVSLRPIFIALGVILMVAVFVLMLATRDTARQLQGFHGSAPHKALQAIPIDSIWICSRPPYLAVGKLPGDTTLWLQA